MPLAQAPKQLSPLLTPGKYASQAYATLEQHTWSLHRLQQLPREELCAKRFIGVRLPNAAWGNSLDHVAMTTMLGLLTDRIVVLNHGLTKLLRPRIAWHYDVIKLLKQSNCDDDDHNGDLVVESLTSVHLGEPIPSLKLAVEAIRRGGAGHVFVDTFDHHNMWKLPLDARDYIATLDDRNMTHLLTHPAFVGLVQLVTYDLNGAVEIMVERLVSDRWRSDASVEISAHIRHRTDTIEQGVINCLKETPTIPVLVSTDRLDVTAYLLTTGLKNPFVFLNYTDERVQSPNLAREIEYLSEPIESSWGVQGQEGWWGADPSGAALVDLYTLSAVRTRGFLATYLSTFSEIAIGLWLSFTDLNPQDLRIAVASPHKEDNFSCRELTLEDFWQFGVQKMVE